MKEDKLQIPFQDTEEFRQGEKHYLLHEKEFISVIQKKISLALYSRKSLKKHNCRCYNCFCNIWYQKFHSGIMHCRTSLFLLSFLQGNRLHTGRHPDRNCHLCTQHFDIVLGYGCRFQKYSRYSRIIGCQKKLLSRATKPQLSPSNTR